MLLRIPCIRGAIIINKVIQRMSTRWVQAGHMRSLMPVLILHLPLLFWWAALGSSLWLHVSDRLRACASTTGKISGLVLRWHTSFFISSYFIDFSSIPFLVCCPLPLLVVPCTQQRRRHHLHTQQTESRPGPLMRARMHATCDPLWTGPTWAFISFTPSCYLFTYGSFF